VKFQEIERWVINLLPSRQFGYVVLTTSHGIMDHEEARKCVWCSGVVWCGVVWCAMCAVGVPLDCEAVMLWTHECEPCLVDMLM